MDTFMGMQVITSIHCTETIEVKRNWRERILSRPWRPWRRIRTDYLPTMYRMKIPPTGYTPKAVLANPLLEGRSMFGPKEYILAHPAKLLELESLR